MRASDESETGFSLLVFVQSPPPPRIVPLPRNRRETRKALVELWICLSRFCEGLV